ncbi:hypothetical protein M413DRAFT_444825 [Hebeloma cylindrosporum]|uniref:Uncharacterized protein n=1 Tax=Hebeloma cylindrosporum TaxID=76867 RepID=A0A0C3C0J6_HEBCY|nr:hypothetical protein M413DRAFT_444825 [Hebeloma cylindrosporum h7]
MPQPKENTMINDRVLHCSRHSRPRLQSGPSLPGPTTHVGWPLLPRMAFVRPTRERRTPTSNFDANPGAIGRGERVTWKPIVEWMATCGLRRFRGFVSQKANTRRLSN